LESGGTKALDTLLGGQQASVKFTRGDRCLAAIDILSEVVIVLIEPIESIGDKVLLS
jgi:hypothetical protein